MSKVEIRRIPSDELEGDIGWRRVTSEPLVRGVEVITHVAPPWTWQVGVDDFIVQHADMLLRAITSVGRERMSAECRVGARAVGLLAGGAVVAPGSSIVVRCGVGIKVGRPRPADSGRCLDDAISGLETTRHLGLVRTLEDQRLQLFDRLWPDFPHDG